MKKSTSDGLVITATSFLIVGGIVIAFFLIAWILEFFMPGLF